MTFTRSPEDIQAAAREANAEVFYKMGTLTADLVPDTDTPAEERHVADQMIGALRRQLRYVNELLAARGRVIRLQWVKAPTSLDHRNGIRYHLVEDYLEPRKRGGVLASSLADGSFLSFRELARYVQGIEYGVTLP